MSKIKLSASKISTLQTCSWLFFYKYYLHGPDKSNSKTTMGTVAHKFLEVMSNKRHEKHINALVKENINSIYEIEALNKFARKLLKKYKLNFGEWGKDLDGLVINEIKNDFYREISAIEVYDPEYEFNIEESNYKIIGFIDSHYKTKDGNRFHIIDYKSKAKEFTDEEINHNIQALTYQAAIWKEKGLPSDVHFKILRHNKTQVVEWQGEEAVEGLFNYFSYLADYLKDYGVKKASSNFAAADKNKRWLCGYAKSPDQLKKDGTPYFSCSARWARDIYYVKDSKGEIKFSTFDINEVELKEGETFEIFKYPGCLWFNRDKYEQL